MSASTQNQVLSALLFLYQEVLKQELGWINNGKRAKKPSHLPVVFTKEEVRAVLPRLEEMKWPTDRWSFIRCCSWVDGVTATQG